MTADPLDAELAAPVPPAYASTIATPRRSRLPWVLALIAFLAGVAAMWFAWPVIERWRTSETATPAATPAQTVAQQPAQAPAATTPATLDSIATREAVLDVRLRAIEQRMAAADAGTRTAAAYARRAEGLLIAFGARRALDRGLPLGYIEGQLQDRFGAEEATSVAVVVAAARAPVTLEDLRIALDRLAPRLGTGTSSGFFSAVKREVGNLVVLRRETTPSPRSSDRLDRARRMIDAGNVEGALAEVARMPGASAAASWIDAAKRYIDARRAVTRLEMAAIGSSPPVATPSAAPAPPAATTNPVGELPGA